MRKPITLVCMLILIIAVCTGCVSQRETLTGTNGIRVEYASQAVMPGCNGQWHPSTSTILLSYGAPEWVLAHEIAHAADTFGSYRTALALVGNPKGLERQTTIAYKLASDADKLGGQPIHLWRAIFNTYGKNAVQHQDKLATFSTFLSRK